MSGYAHVAIDGPAGSGKTTVARALARRLGILYLDTGAMYRAVAWLAFATRLDPADEAELMAALEREPLRVVADRSTEAGFAISAGGRSLGEEELFAPDVTRIVSTVAAHPRVRQALVARQRAIAQEGPVVMAGRDIGSVVLPDAPLKIFLTASVAARVERRLAELEARGAAVGWSELRSEIEERDRLDATRAASPLRQAPGAIALDSTGTSVADVVERIVSLVRAPSA